MDKWTFVAGVAFGVLASVVGYGAQPGRRSMNAQDYTEIRELYSRYYWIADSSPGEKWATELFTPDATWWIGDEKGGQQAVGTQDRKSTRLNSSHRL